MIALLITARDASPQWTQTPTPKNSIADLRKHGLDIVLVIDGTGSMNLIIDDIKAKMPQLARAIHQMVPIARIGIIVFGNRREQMTFQPLTLSAQKLSTFLSTIRAMEGGESSLDTLGGCQTAIERMDWKPDAMKVVVLIGDSPPQKEEFAPLLAMVRRFKDNNGTFNAVDVAAEEHERFEREFWRRLHGEDPPKLSPLPEFYRQTFPAYRVLAAAGDGAMRELTRDASVNRAIFQLVFLKVPQVPPEFGIPHDYVVSIVRHSFDFVPSAIVAEQKDAHAEDAPKLAIASERRAQALRLRDVQFFNMTKTGAHLSAATVSFDVNTVVFVGWEITFDNRLFGLESHTHRVDATYIAPNGLMLGGVNDFQVVSKNMKTVTFTGHVGNSHGGAFLPGTYTVNFSLDGHPVAAKNFEVKPNSN